MKKQDKKTNNETTDSADLNAEIESINQQITESDKQLSTLEAENAELPKQIQAASMDLDVETQVSLSRRFQELPFYIKAEEIRNTRLRIRSEELHLVQIEDKPSELYEPLQTANEAFNKAKTARALASSQWHGARDDIKNVKTRIGHAKLRLEKLESEIISSASPTQAPRRSW